MLNCKNNFVQHVPFLFIQVNEEFLKLERVYRDCIKRTRERD